MHASVPVIVDPRQPPRPVHPVFRRLLAGKLVDDRDAILVQDAAGYALLVPVALLLFVPGAFSWAMAALYLAFLVPRLGPHAVLLHMVTHRRLFKPAWRRWNEVVPWGLAFFHGLSPGSYLTHHLGMHHVEGNVGDDTSSTMGYRRDSLVDFCVYWWRFQLVGKVELWRYLRTHGRTKLVRRLLVGEALHKGGLALMVAVDWRAALVVGVVPYVIVRWGLMMGNWGQHAFIDPADPANPYRNSVTLVNCPYNRTMYNDGYHCAHHVRAAAHWADAPARFEADAATYARHGAVVFDGIKGFQRLWVLLMLRRYDTLADHLVPWTEALQSHEARVAWLRARTRPIPRAVPAPAPRTKVPAVAHAR